MNEVVKKCPVPVDRAVAYLHVADVEQTVDFYQQFGFDKVGWFRKHDGTAIWASVSYSKPEDRKAEIFFAKADGPIIPEEQAVLLYLFSSDVQALRRHLLDCGVHDGGTYCGQAGPNGGRRVVFEVQFPHYMAAGELRVSDPDGYCVLIGQLDG